VLTAARVHVALHFLFRLPERTIVSSRDIVLLCCRTFNIRYTCEGEITIPVSRRCPSHGQCGLQPGEHQGGTLGDRLEPECAAKDFELLVWSVVLSVGREVSIFLGV
jgi:hypothetical protein